MNLRIGDRNTERDRARVGDADGPGLEGVVIGRGQGQVARYVAEALTADEDVGVVDETCRRDLRRRSGDRRRGQERKLEFHDLSERVKVIDPAEQARAAAPLGEVSFPGKTASNIPRFGPDISYMRRRGWTTLRDC